MALFSFRLLLAYFNNKRQLYRDKFTKFFRERWGRASLPDISANRLNVVNIHALPQVQGPLKNPNKLPIYRSHSLSATDNMKFTVTRYNSVPGTDEVQKQEETAGNVKSSFGRPFGSKSRHSPSMESLGDGENTFTAHPGDGDMSNPMARRGRLFANRQKRRFIFKDGECNISLSRVSKKKRQYIGDMFTTLLDMRWRYNILMFALTFVVSWVVFAIFWYIICISHKDNEHADDTDWIPCMANVYDFPTALLFSIETQHTIGYGFRAMEPKCPEAFILLMIQCCFGVFMPSLMTGIIFAKLSRPKGRSHTIKFSKCAVICQRDGEYCMLFRVADMRKSHLVGATSRAMLVKNRITKEGELLPLSQCPLDVVAEHGDNNLFLVWPVTLCHKINKDSPLWDLNAESLISERFEVVVILEGTVESTGRTTQVRTSYLPWEILWGHRLAPLLTYQKENGQYKIDYTQFHATVPVFMPECSAKQFAEGYEESSDVGPTSPVTLCPRMYRQLSLIDSSSSLESAQCRSLVLSPDNQQPKKKRHRSLILKNNLNKKKPKRSPLLRSSSWKQNGDVSLKRISSNDRNIVETIPEVTISPMETTRMLGQQ